MTIEERENNCECGAPSRRVWPPTRQPLLSRLKQEGWFILDKCLRCHALWVEAVYEPYASFKYLILWPYSADQWAEIVKMESGLIMGRWCNYEIRRAWLKMSMEDRESVEHHRQRSIGRNPIDEAPVGVDPDPLVAYLR